MMKTFEQHKSLEDLTDDGGYQDLLMGVYVLTYNE